MEVPFSLTPPPLPTLATSRARRSCPPWRTPEIHGSAGLQEPYLLVFRQPVHDDALTGLEPYLLVHPAMEGKIDAAVHGILDRVRTPTVASLCVASVQIYFADLDADGHDLRHHHQKQQQLAWLKHLKMTLKPCFLPSANASTARTLTEVDDELKRGEPGGGGHHPQPLPQQQRAALDQPQGGWTFSSS